MVTDQHAQATQGYFIPRAVAWSHYPAQPGKGEGHMSFPNTKTLPDLPAKVRDVSGSLSKCQVLTVVSPKATAKARPSRITARVAEYVRPNGTLTPEGKTLRDALLKAGVPKSYRLDG